MRTPNRHSKREKYKTDDITNNENNEHVNVIWDGAVEEKRKKRKKVRENKLEAVAAGGKMEKSFWPSSSLLLPFYDTRITQRTNKSSTEMLRKLNFTLIYLFMALTEFSKKYVERFFPFFIFHWEIEIKECMTGMMLMSRHAIKWEFVWNLFTKKEQSLMDGG